MKLNECLARTVSIGAVLVLCFAALLFASLLQSRAAPTYAQMFIPNTAMSSPTSGPVGTVIDVTGTIGGGTPPSIGTPVIFGYSTKIDCSGMNVAPSSSHPMLQANGSFSGWFSWPGGAEVNVQYYVCAQANNVMVAASGFEVLSTSPPSVSVDHSSYNIGDTMVITGNDFYTSSQVTLTLESTSGNNTLILSKTPADFQGFLNVNIKAPSDIIGTVEIVATVGSGTPPTLKATSDQFTIHNKKTKASAAPTPTPKPTPTHTATPTAVGTATPTPAAAATATPTLAAQANPTTAPSPTVAPTPTQAPVATTTTNNTFFSNLLSGKVPFVLGIGLGMVLSVGILFVGGWLLLHRPRKPTPLPYVSPNGLPPWMRSPDPYMQRSPMMNGGSPFDDQYPAGDGGYAPGPNYGPQQVPYNGPFGTGNAQPQQVPYDDPYGFGNVQPQQVPYDDPFGTGYP